jgi:hypothetical protein
VHHDNPAVLDQKHQDVFQAMNAFQAHEFAKLSDTMHA